LNEIKEHESTDLRVLKILGHEIEMDLGDYRAKIGEAVRIREIMARIVSLPGRRKAIAQAFTTSDIAEGDEIEPLGRPALLDHFDGKHDVRTLKWVTDGGIPWIPTPPPFMSIDASRERVPSGSSVLDRAYPLVRGGVHLVLDTDPNGEIFRSLARRLSAGKVIVANSSVPGSCSIDGEDGFEKWMAIRVGVAQVGATEGESTFIFEVPVATTQRQEGEFFDGNAPDLNSALDQITELLVSTKTSRKTVLIRVPIWNTHASSYAETLNLGDADTCWFIDSDRIDLRKSSSKHGDATEFLSALDRAERAETRRNLLGDEELDDAERREIEQASQLVVSIAHLLDVVSPEN